MPFIREQHHLIRNMYGKSVSCHKSSFCVYCPHEQDYTNVKTSVVSLLMRFVHTQGSQHSAQSHKQHSASSPTHSSLSLRLLLLVLQRYSCLGQFSTSGYCAQVEIDYTARNMFSQVILAATTVYWLH